MSTDEAQIRAQVDRFRDAFCGKDVDAIMTVFAPDVVSFDIVPPLWCLGADALRAHWEKTFAAHEGRIDYEIHDLEVAVSGDLALTHSLNRKRGTIRGSVSEQWLRWTAGWRPLDATWRIVHEHVSVPMDPAAGRALVDLEP